MYYPNVKGFRGALICSLSAKYSHASLAPWCLLAGVNAFGSGTYTVDILEVTINEELGDILEKILAQKPEVLGFSTYIWNREAVLRLATLVKEKLPHCAIILGGPEVSYCPENILASHKEVDFILSGEGEESFALLLNALAAGADVSTIASLSYREEGHFVLGKEATPSVIPPSPYSEDYFGALKGRIAYLETSRGCPFSCAFCLSGRCGKVKHYPLERAKEELLLLANSGTKTVKLIDRTFNADKKRAYDIFQFIIEHYGKEIPEGICFHFELGGDLLDEKTLALLQKAPQGAMQFEIGLQSFHPSTLEKINRKTDVEKLKRNIKSLVSHGNAHIHIDLIAGLPAEDLVTFANSFDTAYGLRPHMLQLGFLKILHGSPMGENPDIFPCDYEKTPPYEVKSTPWLSENDMAIIHSVEDALDRLYNKGRFPLTLAVLHQLLPESAFWFYADFAAHLGKSGDDFASLDALTEEVFRYFSPKIGEDGDKLRDAMVRDRLSHNSTGKLPKALRVEDALLAKSIKKLEKVYPKEKGEKRGYGILYGEKALVWASYREKNPVTGAYSLMEISLDALDNLGGEIKLPEDKRRKDL